LVFLEFALFKGGYDLEIIVDIFYVIISASQLVIKYVKW